MPAPCGTAARNRCARVVGWLDTDAWLTLCLEQLAASQWYGVRVAMEHRLDDAGWTHRVHAPGTLSPAIRQALAGRHLRDEALARVLCHAPPGHWKGPRTHFEIRAGRDAASTDLDGLTTWLLTPVRL